MPAQTHFGCRVIKQDARLTRENYAQINMVTRRKSFLTNTPQKILQKYDIYIDIKSNNDIEKAIALYTQSIYYQVEYTLCVEKVKKYIAAVDCLKNAPDSEQAQELIHKFVLARKSAAVRYDSQQWDELINKYKLQAYNETFQQAAQSQSSKALKVLIWTAEYDFKLSGGPSISPEVLEQAKMFYHEWNTYLKKYDNCAAEEVLKIYLQKEYHSFSDEPSFEDEYNRKVGMPFLLRLWQAENNIESYVVPPDDYIQEHILEQVFPYLTDKQAKKRQERALQNFDINMEFYKSLSREKFNHEIESFLLAHPKFKNVTNLNDYKGVTGIYIMILDEYKRLYVGIARDIKQRIFQHWGNVMPLDRLIFGGVEKSILSIDSFMRFDTTRILVYPKSGSNEELGELEYQLIRCFSPEFLQNRTDGGGESLLQAICERKTLPLAYSDDKE